ncbi:MAG: hypothetical protein QOF25_4700 [Mycobacterium sp.]|nr:hypothetical protein [Mycobacterium sp.]
MRQFVSGVIDSDCTPPPGDQDALHAGPDLGGGVADRRQAARTVPVDRLAGDVL